MTKTKGYQNRFIIIIIIQFLLNTPLYSQARIIDTTASSFVISIDIPQFKYRDIKKGNFNLRDYYDFTDEGSPGSLKLPQMIVLLALPKGSKPVIEVINKVSHTEKFILLARNPQTYLDDAGNLSYEELDFKNMVPIPNQRILDIKGYFNFRGIYCAAVQINTHLYDVNTNSLEIIDKLEIRVTFDNSNLTVGEHSEEKLSRL